jgi:prepilin-type processing-associated H-X9-DG protein
VELLVVVTIISMLAALLLPAVMGARGRARIAQCMNNQHQIALAITQYDMAKQHLPGYVSPVNNPANVGQPFCLGWVPVLLPFLGRMDLWEGASNTNPALNVNGWRTGNPAGSAYVRLNDVICPDDQGTTAPYPLSYAVNLGAYNSPPAAGVVPPVSRLGLFRNYYSNPPAATITLSSVKSPSRTVMLADVTLSGRDWTETRPNVLIPTTPATVGSPLGFSWPEPDPTQRNPANDLTLDGTYLGVPNIVSGTTLPPPLPEIHVGIVNVTFCDGHSESLPDSTLCKNDPSNMIFGMP